MRKASIRDLHIRTSELVRDASEGAVIVIERRGEPVAELRPLTKKKSRITFPDMTELWKRQRRIADDSTQFISEDRDRCI